MAVTESIFNGKTVIIPLADVQHVEKQFYSCDMGSGKKKGDIRGYIIITKHTKWDIETDYWANNICIDENEGEQFISAWLNYRFEFENLKEFRFPSSTNPLSP